MRGACPGEVPSSKALYVPTRAPPKDTNVLILHRPCPKSSCCPPSSALPSPGAAHSPRGQRENPTGKAERGQLPLSGCTDHTPSPHTQPRGAPHAPPKPAGGSARSSHLPSPQEAPPGARSRLWYPGNPCGSIPGCCPPIHPYLCGTAWSGGRQGCARTPGFRGRGRLLSDICAKKIIYLFCVCISFLPPPPPFKRKRTFLGKARQKPASFRGWHCRKEEVLAVSELLTLPFPETAGLGREVTGAGQGAEGLREGWKAQEKGF